MASQTTDDGLRQIQDEVLNAVGSHPDLWADGSEYQIQRLETLIRRAIALMYAIRANYYDTHGFGGYAALELAQKIEKYYQPAPVTESEKGS